jgi:hypothetical protein
MVCGGNYYWSTTYRECWRYINGAWRQQVSISLTFYARLFRAKFLRKYVWYCTYILGLYFLRKNIGAKAARTMLVKLTTGQLQHAMAEQIFRFEFATVQEFVT